MGILNISIEAPSGCFETIVKRHVLKDSLSLWLGKFDPKGALFLSLDPCALGVGGFRGDEFLLTGLLAHIRSLFLRKIRNSIGQPVLTLTPLLAWD